jgi:hypothetical protein
MISATKVKFKLAPGASPALQSVGYIQSAAIDSDDQLSPIAKGTLPYRRATSPDSVLSAVPAVLMAAKKIAGVQDQVAWQSAELQAVAVKGDRVSLTIVTEFEEIFATQTVTTGIDLLPSPQAQAIQDLLTAAEDLVRDLLGLEA